MFMSHKHVNGLLMALLVYSLIGGVATAIMTLILRRVTADEGRRRVGYLVLALTFAGGMALWLWIVRDLQRAFG